TIGLRGARGPSTVNVLQFVSVQVTHTSVTPFDTTTHATKYVVNFRHSNLKCRHASAPGRVGRRIQGKDTAGASSDVRRICFRNTRRGLKIAAHANVRETRELFSGHGARGKCEPPG